MDAKVDTIILFTSQMERLADFYRKGLGLGEPAEVQENHIGFRIQDGLHFGFDQIDDVPVLKSKQGGASVWFRVENLNACVDKFISLGAGIRYKRKETPWGDVLASLYDLDGNIFGLAQR